jgi:transcriptional regulator with GAF, ATPase, and Fis domain
LVAKVVHYNSPRRVRPLVTVKCSAIPKDLLKSELFGRVKGAFTGAIAHKHDLFGEADGGSLFLDEIGELSPELRLLFECSRALLSACEHRMARPRLLLVKQP